MGQYRPRERGIVLAALVGVAIALAVVPGGAGAAVADGVTQSGDTSASDALSTEDSLTMETPTNDSLQNSTTENETLTNGTTVDGSSTTDATNDTTLVDPSTNDTNHSSPSTNDTTLSGPSTNDTATNDSTLVDSPTNDTTNGSLAVDGDASIDAGNDTSIDTGVNATVGIEHGVRLRIDATADALLVTSVNTTLAADYGAAANDSAGEDPDGAAGADGSDGTAAANAAESGDDGGDGGPSGLDAGDAGAGAAVGSLLVGGGLLARRFAETSVATSGAGGGSGGSLLSVAFAWLRAWGWRLLALFGYQRLDSSDPLEHETRAGIYERIEDEPGVFLTELSETTDVPMSTLRYHLRILEFEDLIASEKVRGKRRYVPAEVEAEALEPALDDEATAAVLEAIAEEPDSVSGLADRLDRSPGTVTHHLQRLDEEGLVERERDGRSVVTRLADGVDRTDVVGATAGPAD